MLLSLQIRFWSGVGSLVNSQKREDDQTSLSTLPPMNRITKEKDEDLRHLLTTNFSENCAKLSELKWFQNKCLDKDPEKRYTCEQLFRHPYFDGFNKTEIENDLLSARRRDKLKSGHYLLPQLSTNSLGSSTDMRSSHGRAMKKYDPLPNI
ncbi:hypothetical protein AVEN_130376-1 [Araneus ventricosus]|uniref:Uncharacterized protein n=1 Tax=Araneus ventricosus TaxID=182803 RepID=A0A4Y2BFV9_ARAVE|nr:hypothetical protein AVEN_130376-1 [Araneus ventricosus]